jgi:hypothetical protein
VNPVPDPLLLRKSGRLQAYNLKIKHFFAFDGLGLVACSDSEIATFFCSSRIVLEPFHVKPSLVRYNALLVCKEY